MKNEEPKIFSTGPLFPKIFFQTETIFAEQIGPETEFSLEQNFCDTSVGRFLLPIFLQRCIFSIRKMY